MASGKHGLPAPFNGGEGATRFFKRFECACDINKWETDADRALHVLPLFGDSVFDYAATLSADDRKSYTKLKKAIIKQYDSAILTTSVAEQFSQRTKKEGESLTDLMMALKNLAEKAYAELPEETRERLVRDQFIKSLPSEIHRHVLLQSDLDSSDSLLAEALKAEEVFRSSSQGESATIAAIASPLDSVTKMLATLAEKVEKLEAGEQATVARVQNSRPQFGRRPMQFRGVCYKCNQRGHMARDCSNKGSGSICGHCRNPGHSERDCAIRDKRISDF